MPVSHGERPRRRRRARRAGWPRTRGGSGRACSTSRVYASTTPLQRPLVAGAAFGRDSARSGFARQLGQHRAQRSRRRRRSTASSSGVRRPRLGGVVVDLHRPGLRKEGVVGEVGAQQQHQVGLVHRLVAGAVAEQPAHAHVERVVVLDPLLAAQGVPDRAASTLGQRHDLVVRVRGTPAPQKSITFSARVERRGELVDLGRRGARRRRRGHGSVVLAGLVRGRLRGRRRRGATRTDTPPRPTAVWIAIRSQPRHLLRHADHLAVVAALGEQPLGVGLLEEPGADLRGGDVRGERQHRRPRRGGRRRGPGSGGCCRARSCPRTPPAGR